MLNLLLSSLSPDDTPWLTTHFSKRLKSYKQVENEVIMHFEDGSTAHADLLVGADGIGSVARKTMYTELSERAAATDSQDAAALLELRQPTWTGTYAYRALVKRAEVAAVSPDNEILRGGRAVCLYDIRVPQI